MTSPTIFSLPVPVYQQTGSTRKSQYQYKKRKRGGTADIKETKHGHTFDEIDQLQRAQSQQSSQCSEYSAVLTPDQRSQYRVAGQPFGQSPPAKPFPHASVPKENLPSKTAESVPNRLANLDPPVYVHKSDTRNLPLHQQHLAAMTAILHRSLSGRDFVRAGRALSLILQDEIGGQALDIRAEGRWGIGAEILLRQGAQIEQERIRSHTDPSMESGDPDVPERPPVPWFTRHGFEDAKRYYERMIIQYPFRKPNPSAVSSLDFYPAMFGLWIYVVEAESHTEAAVSDQLETIDEAQSGMSSPSELGVQPRRAVKRHTWEQACEIANRMDACMTTIPYSDDLELIRLRAMVALWVANLSENFANDESDTGSEQSVYTVYNGHARRERLKAAEMFRRVHGDQEQLA